MFLRSTKFTYLQLQNCSYQRYSGEMDTNKLKIAVVGAGAAGLSAAFLAAKSPGVHVTIFEERDQLGGHANTVEVCL
jgi:predicted NAD/FAD-binding protein